MKEKTPQEQTAAARQVELLSNALNGASTEGYWLNVSGRLSPRIYPKGAALSPFNSLTLMLDADSHGYSTALYTTFSEARKRGESVLKDERSVPMNWYRWDSYVNKHDERDIISRDDYRSLPPVQQEQYKAVRKREIHTLFNVEQTTLPHVDEKEFEKLRQQFGGRTDRGNILAEERQTRSAVNRFRDFAEPCTNKEIDHGNGGIRHWQGCRLYSRSEAFRQLHGLCAGTGASGGECHRPP